MVDCKDTKEKQTNKEKYKATKKEAKLAATMAKTTIFERLNVK